MVDKRKQSKSQMRNLQQYKDFSDDDFDELWEKKAARNITSEDFESRIKDKIDKFSVDYDIDDLKINDRDTLRAFVQAIIALEDYESFVFDIRAGGDISQANINVIDRLSRTMSDLRKDISRFQEDLNITRKRRASDRETSVVSYIASLKEQARQYFESKMSYVVCPKCNMVLSTVWTLYPESDNKFTFVCQRTLDDGSKCGNKFSVTSKELLSNRGTNKPDVVPESLL